MAQIILHIDLDAFFCAVEETHNPGLKGKPFAVGGKPDERGVIASCSYAARQFGLRSAMPMARALRLYPNLIVISSRHRAYGEVSRQVMTRLRGITTLVEQISIDEAFLDISDLGISPEKIARGIQTEIRDEMGLPSSIGIASNKLVAKIATEVGKKAGNGAGPPFGLTIVPIGEEAAFLSPLPADMLWGVGPKTSTRLSELGIHTIGDIARWPESEMIRLFGENGRELSRHAHGRDDRPIITEHETKSISQETTFTHDIRDDKALEKMVDDQSIDVGRRLKESNLAGTTIKLKIRWPDFTTLTRQITLSHSTDQAEEIGNVAIKLLRNVRKSGQPVRLIGVGVSGLAVPIRQLALWDTGSEKSRRLQEAIDELRDKYGEKVIYKGENQ